MSGRPRVAVIIPAYNASAFLAETLRSLEAQTFPDWQAVVVDDGSTDATAAIAREAAARDPRIRLVQQSNRGLSASRNRGMAELPGEYFAFLDADDLWEPRKLELQVQVADALGVGLVFCPFRRFGLAKVRRDDWSQRLGYVHGTAWLERLSGGNYINPSCVLLRGELVARYGGFESGLEGAEDWELWLRLAAAGVDCYGVPEVLCRYRMHPNSMSQNLARAFWVQARILPRHLPASWMRAPQVRHSFRVAFRNAFTVEGDAGRWQDLPAMFDRYRAFDSDGWACRLLGVLRARLPAGLFWVLGRYLVIPLAWHAEAVAEKLSLRSARRWGDDGEYLPVWRNPP